MAKKSKSSPEEKARHLWACSVRRMTDDQIYDTYHDAEKSLEDCQKVAAKALEEAAALQERNKTLHDQISRLKTRPKTAPKDAIRTWLEAEAVNVKGIGPQVLSRLLAKLEEANEDM